MDEALRTIVDSRGVFLWREAKALGFADTVIAKAVRSGRWHRVRHGAYTFPDRWQPLDERGRYLLVCRAAVLQSRTPVVLSHVSAAAALGAPLWGLSLREVHLTRADARAGRREAGVRQHQGVLMPEDVTDDLGCAVTSATRAGLEVTTVAGTEASLCVIDDLVHRGLTTPAELRRRYALMGSWPHTLRTDLVLRLADGRSESVGETRTRYLCWRQSLPTPVPQYEVFDELGDLVGRLDFAWPDHGVFLEFDGRAKYVALARAGESTADVVLREKRRQERISELTGWLCLRLTWQDLGRPEHTARRIRQALHSGRGVVA